MMNEDNKNCSDCIEAIAAYREIEYLRNQLEKSEEPLGLFIKANKEFAEEITRLQATVDWWVDLTAKHVDGKHPNMKEYIISLQAVVDELEKDVDREIMVFRDLVGWQKGESRNKLVCEIADSVAGVFKAAKDKQTPTDV